MPQRTTVYIDGFNAYYGIFKNAPPKIKWFDFLKYFRERYPGDEVKIKYFSAEVDDERSLQRQRLLLRAMQAQGIQVILGKFQRGTQECRLCRATDPSVPREKKTDVNIAIEMIQDALDEQTDRIILLSGDADQIPAILWIHKRFSPRVECRVIFPKRDYHFAEYREHRIKTSSFDASNLERFILPNPIMTPDAQKIFAPLEWLPRPPRPP